MSSSEAQKSPVHHATEDATAEPTNETRQPGNVTPPGRNGADRRRDGDNDPNLQSPNVIGGGPDMRTDGAFSGGNVEEDRKKLFPEARTHRGDDDTRVGKDRDESSYGGPLKLDDMSNA